METLRNAARLVLAAALTIGLATAQQLDIPDNLVGGQSYNVGITGGTPGTTVTITIDNADPIQPETMTIEVFIEPNGKGSSPWVAPALWDEAKFTALECPAQIRDVN